MELKQAGMCYELGTAAEPDEGRAVPGCHITALWHRVLTGVSALFHSSWVTSCRSSVSWARIWVPVRCQRAARPSRRRCSHSTQAAKRESSAAAPGPDPPAAEPAQAVGLRTLCAGAAVPPLGTLDPKRVSVHWAGAESNSSFQTSHQDPEKHLPWEKMKHMGALCIMSTGNLSNPPCHGKVTLSYLGSSSSGSP